MYFLCGCTDLVKTSVSVSSSSNISSGLLSGAVNGCEEIDVSKWGLQPVWWGDVGGLTVHHSGLRQKSSPGHSCAIFCCLSPTPCIFLALRFVVTLQQRWQTGSCPPMCFSDLQPIILAEAAAELLKSYCSGWGTDILMACLLLARCSCYVAG